MSLSGQVMTVLGPIPAADLGITLPHEHILNDCRCWWQRPQRARAPASRDRAGAPWASSASCGMDPFVNLDNCALDDEPLAIAELLAFKHAGGGAASSIPPAAASAATRRPCTDRASHRPQHRHGLGLLPAELAPAGAGRTCRPTPSPTRSSAEALDGIDGARIGLIGEIGVSLRLHARRAEVARGAARAQARTEPPADGPPAGLVPPGHRGARHRRGGGRRPAPHRALPHEPVLRRSRLPDGLRRSRRLHRVRHDRHGLFLCRSAGAVPVGRGGRRRHRQARRSRASATACCSRRTCS